MSFATPRTGIQRRAILIILLAVLAAIFGQQLTQQARAADVVVFSQGFETDITGWMTPTRVASGTNGVASKTGGFHAETVAGNFTRWGGYGASFPVGGYTTSVDVYLDVGGSFTNDTRFNFSSAISTPGGGAHRRDFVLTGGFYNDSDATGTVPRFVFSASNNSPGWPKNPALSPFAVTATGWVTIEHDFFDNGVGVLAVTITLRDSGGSALTSWTLSDPTDVIGTTVGGNRYGWFVTNGFSFLAIDNSMLTMAGPQCTTVCYADAALGNDANGGTSAADAKKTIQAAVNQVSAGGTVIVAAGAYPEHVAIPRRSL